MRTFLLFLAVAAANAGALASAQEPRPEGTGPKVLPPDLAPPSSDLPNDEQLEARRSAGGAARPKPVARREKSYSLAELSQFVGEGPNCVILPKGSVLFCPDAMAARVLSKPAGTMTAWTDFLTANRNWITTHEVTVAQVTGEKPISEDTRASFKAAGKMVIATLRGNPVTVLVSPATPAPPSP
jgi:hypothetical protein